MARREEFSVKISADLTAFSRALDGAVSKAKRAGKSLTRVGKNLTIGLTLPIVGIGTAAVSSAVKMEKLTVALNVLTGSAEEGARVFKRLVDFSARTPFQLEALTEVNNMLMGFGLTADQSFDSLKMLADMAALTGRI